MAAKYVQKQNLHFSHDINIAAVSNIKDFVMHVAADLSWSTHVREIATKTNNVANVMLSHYHEIN